MELTFQMIPVMSHMAKKLRLKRTSSLNSIERPWALQPFGIKHTSHKKAETLCRQQQKICADRSTEGIGRRPLWLCGFEVWWCRATGG